MYQLIWGDKVRRKYAADHMPARYEKALLALEIGVMGGDAEDQYNVVLSK